MGKMTPAEKALQESNLQLARTLLKLLEVTGNSPKTIARTKEIVRAIANENIAREERHKEEMKAALARIRRRG
jgi:hypothetical protein